MAFESKMLNEYVQHNKREILNIRTKEESNKMWSLECEAQIRIQMQLKMNILLSRALLDRLLATGHM